MKVRVVAPTRLHFGLINAGNHPGFALFGGLGLMIDTPNLVVSVEPAETWHAEGPSASRALEIAKLVDSVPHRIFVESCPPEHVGLGVGTALSLTVAKALQPSLPTRELALITGRGKRSGIGLHGFELGGFIVDGGKQKGEELPTLANRFPFPTEWKIVLVRPQVEAKWHGETERSAFANPTTVDSQRQIEGLLQLRKQIEELVQHGNNFISFAEAIHDFNHRAGFWFEAAQGGTYASPAIANLVERIQKHGFTGVGQSSWGPTVFAFAEGIEQAEWLARALSQQESNFDIEIATAANHGAEIQV
jgi:beta-ribofuranosylaminobenzene 5'-phosphate synthase